MEKLYTDTLPKIMFDPEKLKLVDPRSLKVDPKNRNKHPPEQIERFCKLLKTYGMRWPILVSEQSGVIKAGEGRLLAALKLGMPQVLVSYQEFENADIEYGFGISDNAIAAWAELDLSAINSDMIELGPDFDIELLGLKDFVIEPIDKLEPGCDGDEIPELAESFVKIADVWRLGTHRLMCGDSTSIDALEKLMGREKPDMVFTDPPYGLGENKSFNNDHPDYKDDEPFDLKLLQLWDCEYLIWGANYYDWLPLPRNKIGWVVWDKRPTRENWDRDTRDAADRRFGQHFEIAITNIPEIRGHILRKTWGGFYGTAGDPVNSIVHKTQKPIELLESCIQDRHKVVLDYFGGSGSTLIACEKTNRRCFMMEIDPYYCGVIIERWQKYSGKKAERIYGETADPN